MNKIFYGLLFFTVIGLGVLFWLMKTLPTSPGKPPVAEEKAETEGVKIVGEGEKEDHEASAAQAAEGAEAGAPGVMHEKVHEAAEHAAGSEKHGGEAAEKSPHEGAAADAEAAAHRAKAAEHMAHAGRSVLSLSTEPVMAKVFVNGRARGMTPLEIPLKAKAQQVKVVAAGYETFLREAPASGDEASGLTWKVQLKAVEHHAGGAKHFASVEPGAVFGHGKLGPAFLQLKAVDAASAPDELVKNIRALLGSELDASVIACRVDLGQRGKWNRILVGPVKSKAKAKAMIEPLSEKLKTRFPDFENPIVTGSQDCGT